MHIIKSFGWTHPIVFLFFNLIMIFRHFQLIQLCSGCMKPWCFSIDKCFVFELITNESYVSCHSHCLDRQSYGCRHTGSHRLVRFQYSASNMSLRIKGSFAFRIAWCKGGSVVHGEGAFNATTMCSAAYVTTLCLRLKVRAGSFMRLRYRLLPWGLSEPS